MYARFGRRPPGWEGSGSVPSKPYVSEHASVSSKVDVARLPPTLALICVVVLAAWMGNMGGGYFVRDWALPALILSALTLLISVIGVPRAPKNRWGALALGLFTAYAVWTLASLRWSPNAGDAWLGAGQTLLYLLAFWAALALVASGASRRWVLAASVLGPALVASFTLAALGPRLGDMFENERLVGSVGYYNGEAAFLLVAFWVAVYLGGSRFSGPILRGAVLGGAVLCLDLAVLTQSRGAMVAMLVSLPVFFLLSGQRLRGLLALVPIVAALCIAFPGLNEIYLAFRAGDETHVETLLGLVLPTVWTTAGLAGLYGLCWGLVDQRWEPPRVLVRLAGAALVVGMVVGGAFLLAGAPALTERAANPVALVEQKWESFKRDDTTGAEQSRYLSASGSGRYALWQVAWESFGAHPVLGIGTHNYEATYYQLREQGEGFVRQPHILTLEVLSERGIVGGALFFGLLATCLIAGLRKRFGGLGSEGKAQAGALTAAVAYWFVHSNAEWFWQLPAVTLPAIVYLALLVSPWWGTREYVPELLGGRSSGWLLRTSGVSVAVLAAVVVAPLYVADGYLSRSHAVEDPAEGLKILEGARRFNPLSSQLAEREAELAIETRDWARVEEAYDRAILLNPEHYAPYMLKATFHERRGDFDEAFVYYRKARALNPGADELERHVERLRNAVADKR